MQSHVSNYLNDFLEEARHDITQIVFDNYTIFQIQQSINEWLQIKQRLDTTLYNQYVSLKKEDSIGRVSASRGNIDLSSKALRSMLKQQRRIVGVRTIEETVEHFKKGYELIHRIREVLTGQEITYSILYKTTKKQGGKLLEAKLKLEDILSATKLSLSDVEVVKANTELSNVINLSVTNASVRKAVISLSNSSTSLENALVEADMDTTLWDSLVKFAQDKATSYNNMGYVYEAYTVLKRVDRYRKIKFIGHKQGRANTENLAEALLERAVKNNDPGWQKGDVALEQLKAVFKSTANLISVSTIERVLIQILKALQTDSQSDMKSRLEQIFIAQASDYNTDLENLLREEAINAIETNIKVSNNKIEIDKT